VVKVVVLAINLAVVGYLIFHIRSRPARRLASMGGEMRQLKDVPRRKVRPD
jgi:hypothetical protein